MALLVENLLDFFCQNPFSAILRLKKNVIYLLNVFFLKMAVANLENQIHTCATGSELRSIVSTMGKRKRERERLIISFRKISETMPYMQSPLTRKDPAKYVHHFNLTFDGVVFTLSFDRVLFILSFEF